MQIASISCLQVSGTSSCCDMQHVHASGPVPCACPCWLRCLCHCRGPRAQDPASGCLPSTASEVGLRKMSYWLITRDITSSVVDGLHGGARKPPLPRPTFNRVMHAPSPTHSHIPPMTNTCFPSSHMCRLRLGMVGCSAMPWQASGRDA